VGALISAIVGIIIALAVIVGLFIGANTLADRLPGKWPERVRPWIFLGPALLFLFIGLVVPTLRTIYLSFRGGPRGEGGYTLDNFVGDTGALSTTGPNSVINFDGWTDIFTSRLFILGVLLVIGAVLLGRRAARRTTGPGTGLDFSNPWSAVGLTFAVIFILFAVFTALRGVLWNNLWWVAAVTGLATVFGLALAVLADRSRNETAAKTMIFMPMAISLVGAAIIWSYMYNIEASGQSPGLLNAVLDLFGRDQIDFLRSATILPWNNFFIMVIMIWIQTGFAMVVLSAAIKSVPADLIEAAKVDGANDVQIFWKITLPQIIPTVLVVVTTLVVTVMKVFDLVKATTNGAFDTDVLANRMYENLRNGNFTMSSTVAFIIFILVLPVMYFNFRRTKETVR
jgi:alpha-glucoside transport system permease protein